MKLSEVTPTILWRKRFEFLPEDLHSTASELAMRDISTAWLKAIRSLVTDEEAAQ